MRINFNLKSPRAESSSVRLVVTHKGNILRISTGLTVRASAWKRPRRGRQCSTDRAIESRLREIELYIRERAGETSSWSEVRAAALASVGTGPGEGDGTPTFWNQFREWTQYPCAVPRTRMTVYNIVARLMGTRDNWNDITAAWFLRLGKAMDRQGYATNYKATVISKVKAVMNEGLLLDYHKNTDFKAVKKVQETADTVYLNDEEIERLWRMDLGSTMLTKARDMFLLGVYTASRFSDYSRLTAEMIHNGEIHFIQNKTAESVVIPASPRVYEILRRNGGKAPKICQQNLNSCIKEVCRRAGIDTPTTIRKSRGTAHIQETHPKYELVSSHTARRTGATLLYMSGVPLRQCMLITGHQSEGCFMKYIKITKEENAKMLASNPFFNKPL